MKIAIIGAGNVGALSAMRIAETQLGEVVMIDIAPGLAQGKALDLADCRWSLKNNYRIRGTQHIREINASDIVIITAGLARRPGMTREELLGKNAAILKAVAGDIKNLSPLALVIVVTNPLDLMTRFVLETSGLEPRKVFGMGVSLDAARFANLIAEELNLAISDIEANVIASHGEGMLPLPRFTMVKGRPLSEWLPAEKIEQLVKRTVSRGTEIVSFLGTGSAYFGPAAAIAALVADIACKKEFIVGLSAYLDGEYGVKGLCIGVPCLLGAGGIKKIIELELDRQEQDNFLKAAASLRQQYELCSMI